MNWQPLFSAIDQKPFHPFALSLTSGERIEVPHPENIHVLPSRQTVNHIEVYRTGTGEFTIIYPEAVAAIHFNGQKTPLD
jgi:hypothetical protein